VRTVGVDDYPENLLALALLKRKEIAVTAWWIYIFSHGSIVAHRGGTNLKPVKVSRSLLENFLVVMTKEIGLITVELAIAAAGFDVPFLQDVRIQQW